MNLFFCFACSVFSVIVAFCILLLYPVSFLPLANKDAHKSASVTNCMDPNSSLKKIIQENYIPPEKSNNKYEKQQSQCTNSQHNRNSLQ